MTAQTRGMTPPRSVYQTALMGISWCALIGTAVACIAWFWLPQLSSLVVLQRMDAHKQISGYILVGLLAFDLSVAPIKRRLVRDCWLRKLQLAHRILGLTVLVLLVIHSGFEHAGFLRATFGITMLVIATGAVFDLLPFVKAASWGQWTTAIHIVAGCLFAALAAMHLYFVYCYAS